MNELWQIIAELGLELHPDRIAAIATKIDSLDSVEQFTLVKSSFGPNADKSMINRLDFAWRNAKAVRPREVAAAFRGAAFATSLHERYGSVELVWTGPSTGLVPVRQTEQVLYEVIKSAQHRIFIVSFVAYKVALITKALQDAIDRHVQVDVLLESSTHHGGKVSIDSVKSMKGALPSANVYVWNAIAKKKSNDQLFGSVHAKCSVSDGKLAFITSANLSTAAMEQNMEIGVLVKGGHLPNELHRHLEALVKTEIVKKV